MRWQTAVSLAVISAVAAETVPIVHDQDFEIFDTMSAAPKVFPSPPLPERPYVVPYTLLYHIIPGLMRGSNLWNRGFAL